MSFEFTSGGPVIVKKPHPSNPLHTKEVRLNPRRWRMDNIAGQRVPSILLSLADLDRLEHVWGKGSFITSGEHDEAGEMTGYFWTVDPDSLATHRKEAP